MRPLILVVTLVVCVTACDEYDTFAGRKWPRTMQPRLSANGQWKSCPAPFCGSTRTAPSACEEPANAHEATQLLATGSCTSEAITALERSTSDPRVLSDLAAAYFFRAQNEDRPRDLLSALENAQDAVRAFPKDRTAFFNLAMIQETLGLQSEAIASWTRAIDDSPWGQEARRRRDALQAPDAQARWEATKRPLMEALKRNDRVTAAKLTANFPREVEEYVEEVLLPDHVQEAQVLAEVWRERTGDPFLVEVVRVRDDQGRREYVTARKLSRAFDRGALKHYEAARDALAASGSPLRILADVRIVLALSFGGKTEADMLLPLLRDAQRYPYVLATILASHGFLLEHESRYLESLAEYAQAIAIYERLHDDENVAIIQGRRSSVYEDAGQHELAWDDAVHANRHAAALVDPQEKHTLLGELGDAARSLGHPAIALSYRDAAIAILEKELTRIPPGQIEQTQLKFFANLSSAHRARAETYLALGQRTEALRDLNDGIRLSGKALDENIKRLLQARFEEIGGQARLPLNPRQAIANFTRALALSKVDAFPTYHASLLTQRAEAYRHAELPAAAEDDLQEAMQILHDEQNVNLDQRTAESERIWAPYFLRFQDALERLVHLLMDDGKYVDAFDYVESARAAEPLDLMLRRANDPEMRELVAAKGMQRIMKLQRLLPAGTFLLEFALTESDTYTWILSRDMGVVVRQPTPKRLVSRWAEDVRDVVDDGGHFFLRAPYERLFAELLATIKRMPGGKNPRLVIVPDGAMNELPFPALRAADGYLIEKATLESAPSALFYANSLLNDRRLPAGDDKVLLIGNPRLDENLPVARGLPSLRFADDEVRKLGALYGSRARMLSGRDATVPAFLDQAEGCAVVHIAGHAIPDERNPPQSVILLAPSADDNGALTAQRLLEELKPGRTRLFVLSTCSSAVAPMVRPFITARVPAVIGTLWNVRDATAEQVMVSFHQHYATGADAAVALQNAQIEFLRSRKPAGTPALAWAAFQVIGHASSPFAGTRQQERQREREKPPP